MPLSPRETPDGGRIERGYVIAATWEAIDNNLVPEGTEQIDPLLTDLLQDSNALDNLKGERGTATRLIWRLGVLRNMADLVIKNIAKLPPDQDAVDGVFPEENSKNRSTARSIITAEPNFLKKSNQIEQDGFWRLLGLDPKNNPDINFIECLDVFRDVKYMPLSIVDELRYQRDNAANMEHPPKIETVRTLKGENPSVAIYPSRAEKEFIEAERQLILGGFLAMHTQDSFDKAFFSLAIGSYTEKTLEKGGVLGLQKAMECAAHMQRLGFLEHERGSNAFHILDRKINSRARQTNIDWLAAEQIVSLAEAVYEFSAATGYPRFQNFKNKIHKQLDDLQNSSFNFSGMAPKTDANIKLIALKRRYVEILHLYKLTPQPSPEISAIAENIHSNLGYFELNEALKVINCELNSPKKQKLRQYFNDIIHKTILNIKLETAEQQSNFIDKHKLAIPVLARFDCGNRLIDRCIASAATLLNDRKTEPKRLLDNIYDAMWANLDFYSDPRKSDQKNIDNLDSLISRITLRADDLTRQKLRQLSEIIRQRRLFATTADSEQESPIYELLNYYKMLGNIKL